MSSAEKELEGRLAEVGNALLSPPSDVGELLPVLDKTEALLSRVEQSPSESMLAAILPAMKGLISKELLGHSDADVKVAVASCISEITRITAPEAPYDDDLMKEIFQLIVKGFEKLDDISSRTYSKRVSILETVAKVRSCVVMLDLECDALILEMFHHFLKTIRDNHPENVFSSMEVIMTLVLEESEDISSELLSLLLMSVKKDKMDILPVARRLAEEVIGNCAFKLKPCLMEVVQSLGAPLSDYSKIVATVCQENPDALEQNGVNVSGDLADDSKFSERTVSDELAQGSGKMESEVSCPEVGTASGRSPKSVMSNGSLQTGNYDSLVEPTLLTKKTERSRRTTLPKSSSAARTDAEKADLIDVKDTLLDRNDKNSKRHKINSAIQSTVTNGHSQGVVAKGDIELPNRKKGRNRDAGSSQSECPSGKEREASTQEGDGKGAEVHLASDKEQTTEISPSSNRKLPDAGRPKRGRPSGAKGSTKRRGFGVAGDVPISPLGSDRTKVSRNTDADAAQSSKKRIEGTGDSAAKLMRHSGKKGSAKNVDDAGRQSSDSYVKAGVDVGGDEEGKLLRKRQKPHTEDASQRSHSSKTKRQRSGDFSYNNDMVSSPKMAAQVDRDENVSEESLKSKARKRRAQAELSRAPGHELKYDGSLVGARIKVWWPDDEQFYPGKIDSYDSISKKHKVSYFDGDVEILLLKDECFAFIEGDEEEEMNNLTPQTATKMPRKKTKRSDSSLRKQRASGSSKSGNSTGRVSVDGTESEGKHDDDATQSVSGRRGGPKFGSKNYASTLTGSKSKEKADMGSSYGTPKVRITSKNDMSKSTYGTPEAASISNRVSRRGRKHNDDTPMTRKKSRVDGSRAGSKVKEARAKVGSKSRSDIRKSGSQSKEDDTTRAVRKPKKAFTSDGAVKLDRNGAHVKVNSSSSRGQGAEDSASKPNPAPVKLDVSEERSGKKRQKKSQG